VRAEQGVDVVLAESCLKQHHGVGCGWARTRPVPVQDYSPIIDDHDIVGAQVEVHDPRCVFGSCWHQPF